jgi:hypothetical protein
MAGHIARMNFKMSKYRIYLGRPEAQRLLVTSKHK